MNKTINIPLKYVLLFIAAFLVLIYLVLKPANKKNTIKITNSEKVEVKQKKDSATIDYTFKKSTNVNVSIDSNKVTVLDQEYKKNNLKKTPKKSIEANRYKDTLKLKNGTIYSDIISTGKVLRHDIKLINYDSIFTKTKTVKETIFLSDNVWFLNVEPKFTLFPTPAFVGGQVSIDYTIKNSIRLGVGTEYNSLLPTKNKMLFNFKIGIQL